MLVSNSKLYCPNITSASPIRFEGAGDRWTVCVLFKKIADGGEQYGRLVSVASAGNGRNGYEVNISFNNANDKRPGLLRSGSSSNCYATSGVFNNGDVVAVFGFYDNSGLEILWTATNGGDAIFRNANNASNTLQTGVAALGIGGAAWGTTRDAYAVIYDVQVHADHIDNSGMSYLSKTHFANGPVDSLRAHWRLQSHSREVGETVATGDMIEDTVSGLDIETVVGSPTVQPGMFII